MLAYVLAASCEGDVQGVMRLCSESCSDWFTAHVPDVLSGGVRREATLFWLRLNVMQQNVMEQCGCKLNMIFRM